MATLISTSPERTELLGAELACHAKPGLVTGLVGDLGAGKTQFVKGFARALGVQDRIHSPTFTLINEYRSGRLPLYHLDLYRLETPEQVFGAGLEDYLPPPAGVAIVEWFDRMEGSSRLPLLWLVRFRTLSETEREITYDDPRA